MRFFTMIHQQGNKKHMAHQKIEMKNGVHGLVLLAGMYKEYGHRVLMDQILTLWIVIKEKK